MPESTPLKFDVIALANTFAILDLILHPLYRLWIVVSPETYESAMHLFVAGLHLDVEPTFDLNWGNFIASTLLEAAALWVLGAFIGTVYNRLSGRRSPA